ncbi:unnamed protein product [Penicillium nalgiovense]|nr:unnamed protein product [Penicillium nalgiovense]
MLIILFPIDAQSDLLIWASTEAWIVVIVGCVPPIRPLMEKVLQQLGFTSKKPSTPYQYRNSSGYAAYGTNKKPFDDDTPDWIELSTPAGTNGSEEHIVNGPKDVIIRTEIETRFEDVEGQVSPPSGDCSISAMGSIHARKVV